MSSDSMFHDGHLCSMCFHVFFQLGICKKSCWAQLPINHWGLHDPNIEKTISQIHGSGRHDVLADDLCFCWGSKLCYIYNCFKKRSEDCGQRLILQHPNKRKPFFLQRNHVPITRYMQVFFSRGWVALSFRQCTPPKFNTAPGWKTTFLFRKITFQGRTVKLQVANLLKIGPQDVSLDGYGTTFGCLLHYWP